MGTPGCRRGLITEKRPIAYVLTSEVMQRWYDLTRHWRYAALEPCLKFWKRNTSNSKNGPRRIRGYLSSIPASHGSPSSGNGIHSSTSKSRGESSSRITTIESRSNSGRCSSANRNSRVDANSSILRGSNPSCSDFSGCTTVFGHRACSRVCSCSVLSSRFNAYSSDGIEEGKFLSLFGCVSGAGTLHPQWLEDRMRSSSVGVDCSEGSRLCLPQRHECVRSLKTTSGGSSTSSTVCLPTDQEISVDFNDSRRGSSGSASNSSECSQKERRNLCGPFLSRNDNCGRPFTQDRSAAAAGAATEEITTLLSKRKDAVAGRRSAAAVLAERASTMKSPGAARAATVATAGGPATAGARLATDSSGAEQTATHFQALRLLEKGRGWYDLQQRRGYKPTINWWKTRFCARMIQYRKRSLKKKNHSKVILRFKLTRFGWQRLRSGRNGSKESLSHKQLRKTMGYTFVSRDDLWKFRFQLPSYILRLRDMPINKNPNIRSIRKRLPSYFG